MGVRLDRLRYEVFQNLFLSPMNTGSVRPAVATTPTARGIETRQVVILLSSLIIVATTPTARGIETIVLNIASSNMISRCNNTYRSRY